MVSDCRSSNFFFVQGTNSVTSNGRKSGRLANHDEEYSDDAQCVDKLANEEAQAENSWEVKEENIESHERDRDALVESAIILHSAHEELEREVQKLRDVGKDDPLFSEDSAQPSESTSSYTLETQTIDLKQNVVHLQSKLKETRVMLEHKEAKVYELESSLNLGDMKTELEVLFKQRIEAEVIYLVMSKTIQNPRTGPIDQIKLNVQQKDLASEHVQALKGQETVETEDALKLQKTLCRFTSCFAIQLILLLVVLYLFILPFSSQNVEVVPT